ncbi:MAG TPA: hypothetical protein PKY10_05470 [Lentisphaeria bacterium]|nr:hypothetical protein [Lentisphaeria bacterium]
MIENIMPACRQNHTPAQNDYDSAENRLKRGVQQPIFAAVPEIKPHPPKGATLPNFCRARGRFMYHPY